MSRSGRRGSQEGTIPAWMQVVYVHIHGNPTGSKPTMEKQEGERVAVLAYESFIGPGLLGLLSMSVLQHKHRPT